MMAAARLLPDVPSAAPVLSVMGLSIGLPASAERALAVADLTLSVMPGETLCVVGESGSGKSMIANAVMGLLPKPHVRPVAGKIMFDGVDLLALDETAMRHLRGRRMGMVFQEPMTALNPVMRIGEQIGEVLDAHMSLPMAAKRQRILVALADVGLPDPDQMIDSYPFRLSGGQRQRVMIACALVLEPLLLICDEPTTALDVTTQAQILKLIRELQQRRGTAVLFITHDFGVVAQIADYVGVMRAGKLVESGPVRNVLETPGHHYTRKLISAIPNGAAERVPVTVDQPYVLQVLGLNKTYKSGAGLFKRGRSVHAVRDISLDLRAGETLGLVGESGSGKSSVGRCLVGLSPIDSGEILFEGQNLSHSGNLRRAAAGRIQMVFQDPYASLNPRHRIGVAIAGGMIAQGIGKADAMKRMLELLSLVGLGADAGARYPHEFSGGQRQRIGIARALAFNPKLLVADEPVSALDVSVQAQVLDLFSCVQKEFQLAMIFITHDLRVAGQMCDRIAVMQRGEIVEYGLTREVLEDPRHPYTQCLIDAVPRLTVAAASTTQNDEAEFIAAGS